MHTYFFYLHLLDTNNCVSIKQCRCGSFTHKTFCNKESILRKNLSKTNTASPLYCKAIASIFTEENFKG